MSCRTDFYVGKGAKAKWIGSCYDGFTPIECERKEILGICGAKDEKTFRKLVAEMVNNPVHEGADVDKGWPWAYDTSEGSDYIYVFTYGVVRCSIRGSVLFNPLKKLDYDKEYTLDWPNMAKFRKAPEEPKKKEDIRIRRK